MKNYKLISLIVLLFAIATYVNAQNGPCKGDQYITNADFFRASASASSSDATASKKKAAGSARTAIVSLVNTKAETAAKSQSKISGASMTQLIELIHIAIRQEAMNMKVICENNGQANGKFNTDVVVELVKVNVLTSIISQVKSDDSLKGSFEEDKFRQAF